MVEENVLELDLTPQMAIRYLREISTDSSRVGFTTHARERMQERNITDKQVIGCLGRCHISEGPYRDLKTHDWKVTVEGFSAGDAIKVVAALSHDETGNLIIVITAYDI